ncbi:MAG: TonB-dependent receptor [Rhodospirillaceae bacterium]|nr:TonB-dependent receptor [Rhodospirillaceae bacterium]
MTSSKIRRARAFALASTSIAALLASAVMPAQAQAQTAQAQTAQAPSVEEIVVTGSRIVRDGYEAPTPVSVLGTEELQAMNDANIADSVNKLPAFSGSQTQRTGAVNLSSGAAGVNLLNLRGMGSQRVLVLLDGKRVINAGMSSGYTGADTNTMPQGLISRVDVVTGGASAAYGSDALSGVVNFILNKEFVGVKGNVQGGVTGYGDGRNWGVSMAGGAAFGGGRGHILLSGELYADDGIKGVFRPWNDQGGVVMSNPNRTATNGLPAFIAARQIGVNNAMPGGLITRGPLKGLYFGPGGTVLQFNYGLVGNSNLMQGGDWKISRIDYGVDLDPSLQRENAYARVSYDIADNVNVHAELQYGRSHAANTNNVNRLFDQVVILSGNPFIPASVQAQMTALKLTSITLGTSSGDVGRFFADNIRQLRRWSVGGDGKFDAFDTNWTWEAYWQSSQEGLSSRIRNSGNTAHIALATDAVSNPVTGAIVCRSTLTAPTNGCVPFNFFGQGVNSRAAIDYFVGISYRYDSLRQDIASFTVNGEPFSTWAGPVSLATGIEHRRESVKGLNTPEDEAALYLAGNFKTTTGRFDVNEGFVETVIPLAKDAVWAKSLDMSAAIRATDYTSSGYVTTWKVGANWQFIDDIRVRFTRSRDIRAAYLGELYAGGTAAGANAFSDPFTGTQVPSGFSLGRGNPTLQPEKADTTGVGMVLTPQFFPGFGASVDYYNIDVTGAVVSPNGQSVIDGCYAGIAALCPNIIRLGPVIGNTGLSPINTVVTSPQNIASQVMRGIDIEASYRLALADINNSWNGNLTLRSLSTRVLKVESVNTTLSANQVVNGLGVLGGFAVSGYSGLTAPKFRMNNSVRYNNDTMSVTLGMRYIAGGVYNNAFTECASGCPANNTRTIDNNHIASNTVYDLGLSYKAIKTDAGGEGELFLSITNLFNQAPPFIAGGNGSGYYSGQNVRDYDTVGRYFTAGVRFKM